MLLLISRVMPVALRPMMPPNFQVLNPILLRILETWIMEGMGRKNLTKKKGIRYNIYIVNASKPPVEATAELHPTLAPPAKLRTLYSFFPQETPRTPRIHEVRMQYHKTATVPLAQGMVKPNRPLPHPPRANPEPRLAACR